MQCAKVTLPTTCACITSHPTQHPPAGGPAAGVWLQAAHVCWLLALEQCLILTQDCRWAQAGLEQQPGQCLHTPQGQGTAVNSEFHIGEGAQAAQAYLVRSARCAVQTSQQRDCM